MKITKQLEELSNYDIETNIDELIQKLQSIKIKYNNEYPTIFIQISSNYSYGDYSTYFDIIGEREETSEEIHYRENNLKIRQEIDLRKKLDDYKKLQEELKNKGMIK